jgi:hypothetical protein
VLQYFLYDDVNGKSMCLLLNCHKTFNEQVVSNLRRHLEACHKEILLQSNELSDSSLVLPDTSNSSVSISTNNNRKNDKVYIDPHQYIKGCIELISENNLSYNTFDSEGFRLISTPIDTAIGKRMNANDLSKIIADTANNILLFIFFSIYSHSYSC